MEESVKTLDNPVKISEWFSHYRTGNRIQKTQGTTVTKYIVDPNRLLPSVLAETDASGNIIAYYIYGLGLISKIEGMNAFFYQYDGLGSTVAITNKDGTVINRYAYDDFGNLAKNSSEVVNNPFKYVGRYGVMTDVVDLLYMRARYYMPRVGRFINKDPIGLAGGLNMYGYAGNNPIRLIDPSGLGTGGGTCQIRLPRGFAGGIIDKVLMAGGGALVGVGLYIGSPVLVAVGGGIVVVIVVKNIYNTINIPYTAQKTASEIWNKTGLREHYEEIDTVGKELDELYGR